MSHVQLELITQYPRSHLQFPSQQNVLKVPQRQLFWRYGDIQHGLYQQMFKKSTRLLHCCTSSTSSSSSSSADQQVDFSDKKLGLEVTYYERLASDKNWQVRRLVETEEEMKKVAKVQAQAFHQPVFFLNDMFLEFFEAEVLSALLYKLRNSPPDRYACLVAEPLIEDSKKELVGVVDVTVEWDPSVLQHLTGADEYLYISGIAVLNKFRRQKVGTTLLQACDALAAIWGYEYLALRAYEDDYGARKLYSNAGYRVVSGDPQWTTWIGRRRRVLLMKRADYS